MMAIVLLGRSDLALVDAGIRALQVRRGEGGEPARRAMQMIADRGLQVELGPTEAAVAIDTEDTLLLDDVDWHAVVEAAVDFAVDVLHVDINIGVSRISEPAPRTSSALDPQSSIDELIQARHAMQQALFDAGL